MVGGKAMMRVAIGVGCRRGCSAEEITGLIEACLVRLDDKPHQLLGLFTGLRKAGEPGLAAAAHQLGIDLVTLDQNRLIAEQGRLTTRSPAAMRAIGLHGLAEAAALAAVGSAGVLLVPKQRSARATCALAGLPALEGGS
jgi:cobalamin biosynthesis protein CbiG